jgi:hypothetical protein
MKRTMVLIVAAFSMVVCNGPATAATEHAPAQVQQKRQKQRAQVIGQGRSAGAATVDARLNAAKVAGTHSFTTVRQTTTGRGEDWTCMLIIEYEVK